ncbi:hypothetical protein DID75_04145 [Candidatus Marinamargulisbacteria bacterium SCGC AG-410-N11]|nr:hypothetical protein DID75_04145 [Candidatus Marinamargulisbacteria bacterium SCGC AG-410-N11]
MNQSSQALSKISTNLKEAVRSYSEVLSILNKGLAIFFPESQINIFLFDPTSSEIMKTFSSDQLWPLPEKEKTYLINRYIKKNIKGPFEMISIKDRINSPWSTLDNIQKDIEKFNYDCNDILYINLISEDQVLIGSIVIHYWHKKTQISKYVQLSKIKLSINEFLTDVSTSLDNILIHKKIESLIVDRQLLKKRIQKDEEDLKRRLLELTVLYETSNALSYTLNYTEIVETVMNAIKKVLSFDICSTFLWGFSPGGEIITHITDPTSKDLLDNVHQNLLSAITPFLQVSVNSKKVTTKINKTDYVIKERLSLNNSELVLKSFANVPLIFKENVLGMLNICARKQEAFGQNEMTFLHTMSNLLSSSLGRLKIIKELEQSKISTVVQHMNDAVLLIDNNFNIESINLCASSLFNYPLNNNETNSDDHNKIIQQIDKLGLSELCHSVFEKKEPILNHNIYINECYYSINITPIIDDHISEEKILLVFRDISDIEKINKIKTQQLELINKVNLIMKSILDLDSLLKILIKFILNIAKAEMGSIQLKKGKLYFSKVHSNFPDKIRRLYRFKTGETISDYVIRTKKLHYIPSYSTNSNLNQNTKFLISYYLCIPIMIKNDVIGVLNIVRKLDDTENIGETLSEDDISILSTITMLSSTAIQNALLHQDTVDKERLDQELKVATQIQTKLLPEKLPSHKNISFGALYVPAQEIGGDYYDFFKLSNGNLGIIVADIVGKGIPASLFMAMLKSILQSHIKSFNSPKKALETINETLLIDSIIDKFIPLFYGILDLKTLEFKYCNAGHEPGLLLQNNKVMQLDTKGLPLAALSRTEYQEKSVILKDQDILLLSTDGIIDTQNFSGERFGLNNLMSLMKQFKSKNATQIVNNIYSTVHSYSKSNNLNDDFTLICLKVDKSQLHFESKAPLSVSEISVSSKKNNIKKIRNHVKVICTDMQFSESEIFNVMLAVNEAQANIIEHAYFGSEKGDIIFTFNVYKDKIDIIIKDYGAGIDQKSIKGGKNHLEELEGSGLGIFLIKSLMDDVELSSHPGGTQIKLTKYKKGDKNGSYKKIN